MRSYTPLLAVVVLLLSLTQPATAAPQLNVAIEQNPLTLGQSTQAVVSIADLILPEGVSALDVRVVIEILVDAVTGSPVAAGTPGAEWRTLSEPSLTSSYHAMASVDSMTFGIGVFPMRARLLVPNRDEIVGETSLSVTGN